MNLTSELPMNTTGSTYARRGYYDDEIIRHMSDAGIPSHLVRRVVEATEALYRHAKGCRICGDLFGPHAYRMRLELERLELKDPEETRHVWVCRDCFDGIYAGFGIDEMCDRAAVDAVAAFRQKNRARVTDRMEKLNSKPCAVYVMHAPDLAVSKVGISVDPVNRKNALEKEHKTSIRLVNAKIFASRSDSCLIEKKSHRELAPHMAEIGREWFEVDPQVATDAVSRIAESLGISPIDELGDNGRRIRPLTSKCFADVEMAA